MRVIEPETPCFGAYAVTGLLRHLLPGELTRIRTHFETITVCAGDVLIEVGDFDQFLYFSQGPMVSVSQSNGVELALIGSEGMLGWPALDGVIRSPFRATVRGREGVVLRMALTAAVAAIARAPRIGHLFHLFSTVVGVQMAETLGACALRRVEMRIARWVLLRHDRVGGDEILVQHEEIADNLGTRRASVTDALHVIEGAGLIRCRRGRLQVRDRSALEGLASGHYGQAETIYRCSIGAFGKLPATQPELHPALISVI